LDDTVVGNWTVVNLVETTEAFDPADVDYTRTSNYWWQNIEFRNDGTATASVGSRRNDTLIWAENEILFNGWWKQDTPEYTLQTINDTEYLFIEWDYPEYINWQGEQMYFVFERN
jgi:hypothetical protein